MFFTKSKISASTQAIKEMESGREEINRRMETLNELNTKLGDVVSLTKELASNVTNKVNKELKVAKKTLTSFSSKINDGMVMINSHGKIIHLNKVGSKIFGMDESEILGKYLSDIITCANPMYDDKGSVLEKPIMQDDFFKSLSDKIFLRLVDNATDQKYLICNDCLREDLPFCFETDDESALEVKVILKGKKDDSSTDSLDLHSLPLITLRVTFSVLDNDPENIDDVTYVFLFSQDKSQHK